MKIEGSLTDEIILKELAGRFARLRIRNEMTQAQLAEEAGVSMSTIQRLESGEVSIQLIALIRIMRALKLLESFDQVIDDQELSPIEQMDRKGKTRKRVRHQKKQSSTEWKWGE